MDPASTSEDRRASFLVSERDARLMKAGRRHELEGDVVLQAANDLKVNLGWVVQIYNAAEALPNLLSPFWMLPLLGLLSLRARDLAGYASIQLAAHIPIVLFLLWLLAKTLPYVPPAS